MSELYGLPDAMAEALPLRCLGQAIPERMWEPIAAYLMLGRRPGDFLAAVIRNDFKAVALHADETNGRCLRAFAAFFHNFAPQACQGSEEALDDWCDEGGMHGPARHRMRA